MPKEIKLTILWDTYYLSVSAYSIYDHELMDIYERYGVKQLNMFYCIDEHILSEWINDVYVRCPEKIYVDQIIY
tara:strand:+ start:926 stop:1147 length:222 start_codon:yes stop_codon:yes gene_type:complete